MLQRRKQVDPGRDCRRLIAVDPSSSDAVTVLSDDRVCMLLLTQYPSGWWMLHSWPRLLPVVLISKQVRRRLIGQRHLGDFVRLQGATNGASCLSGLPARAGFKHSQRGEFRESVTTGLPQKRTECDLGSDLIAVRLDAGSAGLSCT